jgi:transposase-like protein
MWELSVVEQRYRAVIGEGETVTSVAARFGVARQTVHVWLARHEGYSFPHGRRTFQWASGATARRPERTVRGRGLGRPRLVG